MGLYIHGLLENNLYENDMEHTINKLCSLLNKRLFITHNHIAPPLPDDIENYIVADLFYTETINDEIKKEGDIWIDIYDEDFSFDLIISKTGVLVGDFKFKWYFFDDYLKGDTWLKEYFEVHIEDIIQIGKLFNSKQLLLYPDELLEVPLEMKILEENHLIDNVLSTLKDYTIVSDKDIPLPEKDEIWIYRKNIETNSFTLNDWENYWANRKEPEIQYEDD